MAKHIRVFENSDQREPHLIPVIDSKASLNDVRTYAHQDACGLKYKTDAGYLCVTIQDGQLLVPSLFYDYHIHSAPKTTKIEKCTQRIQDAQKAKVDDVLTTLGRRKNKDDNKDVIIPSKKGKGPRKPRQNNSNNVKNENQYIDNPPKGRLLTRKVEVFLKYRSHGGTAYESHGSRDICIQSNRPQTLQQFIPDLKEQFRSKVTKLILDTSTAQLALKDNSVIEDFTIVQERRVVKTDLSNFVVAISGARKKGVLNLLLTGTDVEVCASDEKSRDGRELGIPSSYVKNAPELVPQRLDELMFRPIKAQLSGVFQSKRSSSTFAPQQQHKKPKCVDVLEDSESSLHPFTPKIHSTYGKHDERALRLLNVNSNYMLNRNCNTATDKFSLQGTKPISIPGVNMIDSKVLEIGSFLGGGANGKIHLGTYGTSFQVAVKKIPVEGNRMNVEREVGILSKLKNEHTIRLVGLSITTKDYLIVMGLVQGTNLEQIIFRKDRLPPDFTFYKSDKIRCARQSASGSSYLHKMQILHRDFKPGNIVISYREKNAKICDMGMAKDFLDPKYASWSEKLVVGTKIYTAPEVFSGKAFASAKSESWSLGVSLAEMFGDTYAWRRLTMGESVDEFLRKIYLARQTSMGIMCAPVFLRDVIYQCLSYNVEERATVDDVLAAFRNYQEAVADSTAQKIKKEKKEDQDSHIFPSFSPKRDRVQCLLNKFEAAEAAVNFDGDRLEHDSEELIMLS